MKNTLVKALVLAAIAVAGFFVLSGSGPAQDLTQTVVDLPPTVEADVTALVLVAVGWALAQLVALVPFLSFLRDFVAPLALAISSQLIGLIEGAVPDAYGAVAILAIQLILAVIAVVMTLGKLRERGVRALQ